MIGNDQIQKQIRIVSEAAKKRNTSLPHMLFSGAPGCGKTTLARETAQSGGMSFIQIPPESLKGYKEVIDLLGEVNHDGYNKKGDVIDEIKPTIIFIDEIHRLPIQGQEKLGIAMENYQLESDTDKNKFIWFPLFTIVGATTEEGILSKPFRDRFKLNFTFKLYDNDVLTEITAYHGNKMEDMTITRKACKDIASRSRGTPRIAVKYLERARDYAMFIGSDIVTSKVTEEVFNELGIDHLGLNEDERSLLMALYEVGTPIGANNLSVITNVSEKTIADSIEPFLIHKGLISRSGKGRMLTPKGRQYIYEELIEKKEHKKKNEIDINYNRKLN